MDASSVANEAWRTRCRLWVTGADEDGVQGSLNIARYQLIISVLLIGSIVRYRYLTPGRKYHPARENIPFADMMVFFGRSVWWNFLT